MDSENLFQNIYSYVRLAAGSIAVFGGAYLMATNPGWEGSGGILIGGVGLALALHETAYIGARFLASFLKQPPGVKKEG